MSSQLHEAYGIVRARTFSRDDRALLRSVELSRGEQRRTLRSLLVFGR